MAAADRVLLSTEFIRRILVAGDGACWIAGGEGNGGGEGGAGQADRGGKIAAWGVRMRRVLFKVICALSAAICVGLLCLWQRTVYWCDAVEYRTAGDVTYAMMTYPHGLQFSVGWGEREYFLPLHVMESSSTGWNISSDEWGTTKDMRTTVEPVVLELLMPPDLGLLGWPAPQITWFPPEHRFAGFAYEPNDFWGPVWAAPFAHARFTARPLWFLVILFAVMPGLWVWGWMKRRRRVRNGVCLGCGYDLRVSEERCPECGGWGLRRRCDRVNMRLRRRWSSHRRASLRRNLPSMKGSVLPNMLSGAPAPPVIAWHTRGRGIQVEGRRAGLGV